MRLRTNLAALAALSLSPALLAPAPSAAQEKAPLVTPPSAPKPAAPRGPVGLPQDAGQHDQSTIEWWYFNSFLTSESGKRYAVVGSFFRTGLGGPKGHYLIYALADLDARKKTAYSVLDKAERALLLGYLPLIATQKPEDPRPMRLLALLQKGRLPEPHRALPGNATVETSPFRIAFGKNRLAQASADARTWKADLQGDDFTLSLTLSQPDRPPMLVGGAGKTGLRRPEDMYYLSLTRMRSEGTLTRGGKTEKVTGEGWLDRQWGTSWVVEDNGWDWFGLQLSDGSDLIVYRIKDNATGKILRAEATLLDKTGKQVVDKAPVFSSSGEWTDPATKITYPQTWRVTLPTIGHTLTITPAFAEQTIPVIGIGDAIWEGVVNVSGAAKDGTAVSGRGYMELVGYRAKPTTASQPKRGRASGASR